MAQAMDILPILAVMIAISGYLIWTILNIRQRRLKFAADGGDNYKGEAKEPEALMKPHEEALAQKGELLEQAGLSLPEEE